MRVFRWAEKDVKTLVIWVTVLFGWAVVLMPFTIMGIFGLGYTGFTFWYMILTFILLLVFLRIQNVYVKPIYKRLFNDNLTQKETK